MPLRQRRRRIFFGCEGESEISYGRRLQEFLDESRCAIHLERVNLGGGGPLAMIEKARREIKRLERNGEFHARFALLDSDRIGGNHADVESIASKLGLRLILQHPCHEAFLLRHLDGCASLRPQTSDLAERELKRRWPEYCKGIPAARLAKRIDLEALQRARQVEVALHAFLALIGL